MFDPVPDLVAEVGPSTQAEIRRAGARDLVGPQAEEVLEQPRQRLREFAVGVPVTDEDTAVRPPGRGRLRGVALHVTLDGRPRGVRHAAPTPSKLRC